jgi:hypothetical protein
MRSSALLAAAVMALVAGEASAWCVKNELRIRSVRVEQDTHPEREREGKEARVTLAPGERFCCKVKDLDCNPLRRIDSYVPLTVRVPGEPVYECGFPAGAEPGVTITGGSNARITENPRYPGRSSIPYLLRIRTQDGHDSTGPAGLPCPPAKKKGPP